MHLRTLTVMSSCTKCMKEDKQGEGVMCVGEDGIRILYWIGDLEKRREQISGDYQQSKGQVSRP